MLLFIKSHFNHLLYHHFTLDARSLASFRILLGLYLLYDLWSRLSLGKYDLAWYTQDDDPRGGSEQRSYLHALDTPHQAPMHRIWFHRGSPNFQIAAFALSGILSLCFCLGFYCCGYIKALLWIVQVSQVSRNMYLSDGSDSFIRHLLLWSCFLPVSQVWSLDAYTSKPKLQEFLPEYRYMVSGLPCLALMLQICFMYWGTVFHRTLDIFPWSQLDQSQWLPPKLSAVHYALAGSFATRDNVLTRFLRSSSQASALATLGATLVEVVAPLACLLVSPRYRHWFALQLFALHLGLYASLNLPNWQFVGMLATVIWIPSHFWDERLPTTRRRTDSEPTSVYKKTDGDTATSADAASSTTSSSIATATIMARANKSVSRFLQCFFFLYMIYNWLGNRGWIQKHDGGDIGEGLRLSQYWVMYSQVGDYASITALTGRIIIVPIENDKDSNGSGDDKHNATRIQPHRRRIDLYHYIRTKQMRNADPADYIPHNMTNLYPSPRWERILNQWAGQPYKHTERARRFIKVLCTFINEDLQSESLSMSRSGSSSNENVSMQLTEIEMTWRNLDILPPGSSQRYADTRPQHNTVTINVQCSEDAKYQ